MLIQFLGNALLLSRFTGLVCLLGAFILGLGEPHAQFCDHTDSLLHLGYILVLKRHFCQLSKLLLL